MAKEIRLEVKARNNRVLTRMEELGINTVAELCRQIGKETQQALVGAIINMKESPLKNNPKNEADKWKPVVLALAEVLQADPEDLFPESVQAIKMPKGARIFAEVTPRELRQLAAKAPVGLLTSDISDPEMSLIIKEAKEAIEQGLKTLTPREEKILRLHFGFEDGREYTEPEIADKFGLDRRHVRQIMAKALRKMRHPSRSRAIRWSGALDLVS